MLTPIVPSPYAIDRTGVIQPYDVVTESPVTYARQAIVPFLQSLDPEGMVMPPPVQLDGAGTLGLYTNQVVRTVGMGAPGLGVSSETKQFLFGGLVGVAVGVVGSLIAVGMKRGKRRR